MRFAYEPSPEITELLRTFRDMVNYCIERALEHGITSFMRLRKLIYEDFKAKWPGYNTQYCYSAVRIACSMLKSWRKRVRRGQADPNRPPRARKPFIRFSPLLTKLVDGKLRISVRPRQFIYVKLIYGPYQARFIEAWHRGEVKMGEVVMNDRWVIIPFIKYVDLEEPSEAIAIDINEGNITAVDTAYMLGFVSADCSVRKRGHRIEVHLGTTREDTLEVFLKTFSKFGHINIIDGIDSKTGLKRRDAFIFLPLSFDYLRDAKTLIPNDYEPFIAYLAGALDGDGSIKIRKRHWGMEFSVRLLNTDKAWLERISYMLRRFGFHPNIRKSGKEWELALERRREIFRIARCLLRYMKHKEKRHRLEEIVMRGAGGPLKRPLMMLPGGGSERGKSNFSTPSTRAL